MADFKQRLQDALQAAESEGRGFHDPDDKRAEKKIASLHYKRRKLDKDVKGYIKDRSVIRGSDIERIGKKHGFYVGGTLLRKD